MFKKLAKFIEPVSMYAFFLLPCVVVVALIWSIFIDGKLYYCSDSLPIISFIPPFVHSPIFGDRYIVDEQIVWTVWYLHIGFMLILPLALIAFLKKYKKEILE